MKLRDAPETYSFDDFCLVPGYSSIKSRKEPDVSTIIAGFNYKIPIFASPMNSICELDMATAMFNVGGGAVIHRYMPIEKQVEIQNTIASRTYVADFSVDPFPYFAVGAAGDFMERAQTLYNVGVRKFCVDVANGHSTTVLAAVESLKRAFSNIYLMAGNVCTFDGARNLAFFGADSIRVGIGNGSACKTRLVTGHGVPQLSALEDCYRVKETFPNVALLSDGGVRTSGDCIKALCFADAVMMGRLLAGTDETPGAVYPIHKNGEKPNFVKKYAGMASKEGREFNGWFSEENSSFVPEGISTEVPYQGPVAKVIENLVGGIKTGMSLSNARTLEELRQNAKWARVTNAGFSEGLPRL